MPLDSHEAMELRSEVKIGSERSFGFVMAGFFAVVSAVRFWKGEPLIWLFLSVAVVFLVLALFWTRPLRPLNQLWFRFGLLLHRVISPIIMAVLFFTTVTPMAVLLRIFGKDVLNLGRDDSVSSYWVLREPPGPAPESMKNQF